MSHDVITITEADVRYFEQKYERALKHGAEFAEKSRKQLELIKDSVIIYIHEGREDEKSSSME
jgi:hypothetical protein